MYGKCSIEIPLPTFFGFFAYELTRPFMFFQYMAGIVWVYERLIFFMVALYAANLILLLVKFVFKRYAYSSLNQFSRSHIQITVYRKRDAGDDSPLMKRFINSEDLVPGDVIDVPVNKKFPVDAVLLSGSVKVNEAILTGESFQVNKAPL